MSWNLIKSGNVLKKILPMKTNSLGTKMPENNIMPVEGNFDCRRKRVPVYSLDIPC